MNPTRRNLLRALGLLGPAYFLPSLHKKGSRARAAAPTIPTRILFFYTPHGQLLRQWVAPPSGASAPTATSFALGPSLAPLASMQSQLTLVEGLDFQSEYPDTSSPTNGHIGGETHALSSISRVGPSAAGGISIDQFIANGINTPTPLTQLPSLQMSSRVNPQIAPYLTSWAGANSLVPPMTDPAAVYALMFPNGPPSTGSAATAAAVALSQRRKSILDAVLGEFNAVQTSLSAADKAKLDSQASLIRDLEVQLGLSSSVTCAPPSEASVTSPYEADCKNGGGNCVQEGVTSFTSLAVAALACDITRVITLDVDTLPDALFSSNPNVPAAGGIHGFLHGMDDSDWYSNDHFNTKNAITSGAQDATNIKTATSFYAMYAQMLANLLQQLAAVPESDGSTLLDHTIVVWCSEFGSPNHIYFVVDYLLAGGGAAGLTPGRYLNIPRLPRAFSSNVDYYANTGVPHSNLFVSLANLMGLSNVTTFGNPKTCTGPLTQLTSG
jgi:hypothetical protein